MIRRALGWGIVLIAAGLVLWRVLPQSDERMIRSALRQAVRAVEKKGPENPVAAARRADRAAAVFAPEPDEAGYGLGAGWTHRSQVRAGLFRARAAVDRLSIRLSDVSVEVDPDGEQALLRGTARVSATGTGDLGSGREIGEFESYWIRTEEGWRLARIRPVEAIRRPVW